MTMVHISDLHFGHLSLDVTAPLDAPVRDHWRMHSRFDGYLGHSHQALVHLQQRISQLRERESAKVLITGDITACGHPDQFQLAKTYFLAKIPLSKRNHLGLAAEDGLDLSIPGNHDHWPGDGGIFGSPSAGLINVWPQLPFIYQPIGIGNGLHLQILGINSDADTGSHSLHRFLARGSFNSQLQALDKLLGQQEAERCIRVLLIHHSRLHVTWNHAEMIASDSRQPLDKFLNKHRISLLLTGHVHVPHLEQWSIESTEREWTATEIRCGTTTQRDTPPEDWGLSKEEVRKRFSPNTLVVHRVLVDDARSTVTWNATVEVRTAGGFVAHDSWPPWHSQVWPPSPAPLPH